MSGKVSLNSFISILTLSNSPTITQSFCLSLVPVLSSACNWFRAMIVHRFFQSKSMDYLTKQKPVL